MKDKFTVSEMAKFACVTVDALKYYDRMDLYKPAIIDENSSYRYYTLDQYADIVLIRDLRNIGLSVSDIKLFLQNRSIRNSTEMLTRRKKEIAEEINLLQWQSKSIANTLDRLRKYDFSFFNALDIQTKMFPDRMAFTFNENVKDKTDLKMGFVHLESSLYAHSSGTIDTVYGAFVELGDNGIVNSLENNFKETQLFSFINSGYEEYFGSEDIVVIPEGKYACMYYEGEFWKFEKYMKQLLKKIQDKNFEPEGPAIVICGVDNLAFGDVEDYIYEIQIKLR